MPAIPAIIMGGAAVAGSAIASHGNTEAAKTQASSDEKALAQAKEIYQQQRADQGPYRQSGYGALGALNFGLGLPDAGMGSPAASGPAAVPGHVTQGGDFMPERTNPGDQPNQGTAVPRTGGLGSIGSSTVSIKAPNGLVYLVPSGQVDAAMKAGGTRI